MSAIHTLYLIHHSHTDIGYTHDQPIVFDLHRRFLDEALDWADRYADRDTDGAFRWTVETTFVLYRWLQQASQKQIDRFRALERVGRIEVTAMFANLTPLCDTDQLIETFQLLRPLREEFGFTIRHAMNCDVNGENWPLVDLLLDVGIEGFSMAINTHFGGAPLARPNPFWWQGPSGRRMLAYNGWPYDTGWRFGIGRDAQDFEQTWWPRVQRRLDDIGYALPVLMAQSFHPYGDNASAYGGFSDFIDDWNARGSRNTPRVVMATPAMWWAAVKEHSHQLPTYRGDWTDFWNFGCISSAREQAMNRASRTRLRSADLLAATTIGPVGASPTSRAARSFTLHRQPAWHALHLWDEHTWGADGSVRAPGSEDTAAQWYHKAGYAYTARSLSLLLQRDALAEFARGVQRSNPTDLLVFNALPWPRKIGGQVPANVASPRGVPADMTSGRHFQDRAATDGVMGTTAEELDRSMAGKRLWLRPIQVPGFGYAVVARNGLVESDPADAASNEGALENEYFRVSFDLERGGILSCYDKRLQREWVDRQAGYPLHGFVHEEVADHTTAWPRELLFHMDWKSDQVERPRGWKPGWPARRTPPTRVLVHRVYRTPLGQQAVQILDVPGCAGPLKQRVFLPDFADWIECEAWWDMGLLTHPEATYLVFPFEVPDAVARIDLGGQAMMPGRDQLPGVCYDYFTAQHWVDFSNEDLGVTVALPDNPMVQFGDFNFARNQPEFKLQRALLLGWATNNYWETNFRAHQPGQVHTRYRIWPHRGGFDEAQAHRFGLEAAQAEPLFQHLGEPPAEGLPLPGSGALLHLPQGGTTGSPVLTLHVKPAEHRPGIVLRLLNASDDDRLAEIGSGLLRIVGAQICDLLEAPLETVGVQNGLVRVHLAPRRSATVLLDIELATSLDQRRVG
jgi:alpha-mannosidase